MKRKCFWRNPGYKACKPLTGHHKTRYLIIGGGVAGLFIAHYLLKKGVKKITVIDKGIIGSGSTGQSAGMLVAQLETAPIERLATLYGRRAAVRYAQALKDAQGEVRRLIRKGEIACEYKKHSLKFFKNESGKGKHLEESISVNPIKFIQGMAQYLRSRGVVIYENTSLRKVQENIAVTPQGTIRFEHIAYALGTSVRHKTLENYVTTICVTRPLSSKKIRRLRHAGKEMFFHDERQSYLYGKITQDRRLLVGYGDVRRKSTGAAARLHVPHVRSIKRYIRRAIGANVSVHRAWSAAYSLSKKPLPYVSVSRGIIGGAGTQIATIAIASYLASAILGEKHPLNRLFTDR
ncbi:FAD-binding oxidoreductase [Candidatus Parcubacteria bacterium]|nr:MAG: FAD-binding oxidoreductase [Candidatus Parcubacteria bacterium]